MPRRFTHVFIAYGALHGCPQPSLTNYSEEFGDASWAQLAKRADALRNLVRIKVADDNDLKTAHAGLQLCGEFFDGLAELSSMRGDTDQYETISHLALSA